MLCSYIESTITFFSLVAEVSDNEYVSDSGEESEYLEFAQLKSIYY